MQRKFSKFVTVLAVCLMAFPCLTYAASSNTSAPSHSSDKATVTSPSSVKSDLSDGVLYDNPDMSSKSSFTSSKFVSTDSTNIRVWYNNQGSESAEVKLYRESWFGDKKIGSFTVDAGKSGDQEFAGSEGATYYIGVDSENGSTVKGYLRAKQGNDETAPPSNGDLYDNPRINSKSTFTSSDFTTNNSNDIRVWFDNQGSESVTVSLFKKGWLGADKVGHFSVSAGTNDYKKFRAEKGVEYHIIIDSDNGADVHGYLRAKQAD